MPDWETFAVVTGGVAGALVGLFFVAVSINTRPVADPRARRPGRAAAAKPGRRASLPKAQPKEKRFLSHAEVQRLADAAGDYGVVIEVLAFTGLRFGELAALRVGRVDLMRRRIDITEPSPRSTG
jgi:integrase